MVGGSDALCLFFYGLEGFKKDCGCESSLSGVQNFVAVLWLRSQVGLVFGKAKTFAGSAFFDCPLCCESAAASEMAGQPKTYNAASSSKACFRA